MPKWISLPDEPLLYQPIQIGFLEARRLRICPKCTTEYAVNETLVCPTCQVRGFRKWDRLTIIAGRRFGKGLALDTPLPTPDGWKLLDDIKVGDAVFDETGTPTIVQFVSDIHHLPCYRVTFSDGTSVVADCEHQWLVWSKRFRKAVRRAKRPVLAPEVKLTGDLLTAEDQRDAIPLCAPLKYDEKTLLVSPYTLGAWLGDGDSNGSALTCADPEILTYIEADGFEVKPTKDPIRWTIGVKGSVRNPTIGRFEDNDSLHSRLKRLGLQKNKHISTTYLTSSVYQREELLKGLMDTDGYCDKRGLCEFTTIREQLFHEVTELITGLGYRPSCSVGTATLNGKAIGPKYRISFWADRPVFKLHRKLSRQQFGFKTFFPVRYITAVEPIAPVPTKCLQVDSPSSLFLVTKGCVPTHNTRIGAVAAAEEACLPRSIGWCTAPTNPKLHRYVIPAMQQLIPDNWVKSWNSDLLDLRLKNDSLIHFQTLETPDQGRGQGLDWLWVDEVCELSKAHWEVIRPSLAGDTAAFFTSSPRGFDWVHQELYEPAGRIPGYWAARARTIDSANPRISKEFLERERAQMSDVMYRQEYEADFVIFTGAVYGGLIEPQVLRGIDAIRSFLPEWPRVESWRPTIIGLDTGADHPFGAIKIVSTEKGLVVVSDYLERNKSFIEHAHALKRLAGSGPAKWAINKNEKQPSIELAQHGIFCQKAENDQMAGIERVKSWLVTGQLWFVSEGCPRTIDQLKSYRYADNLSPKDEHKLKEKVFKRNDELPDCLRYALMTWPVLPQPPLPDSKKPRDLSHLAPEVKVSVERLRRLEGRPEPKDEVTGDFFL